MCKKIQPAYRKCRLCWKQIDNDEKSLISHLNIWHKEECKNNQEMDSIGICDEYYRPYDEVNEAKRAISPRDFPKFITDGSYQIDMPLHYYSTWLNEMKETFHLEMEPDFQRGHVWTKEQQIKWLEFLFKGGKSGLVLYFNYPSWHAKVPEGAYNDMVCVDGLQRSTAILKFISDSIPVFGTYYTEFKESRLLNRFMVKININDLKTKKEVLQWYLDMNDGGVVHTSEEILRVKRLLEQEK